MSTCKTLMTLREAIDEAKRASDIWYKKTAGCATIPPTLAELSIEALTILATVAGAHADDTVEIVTLTEGGTSAAVILEA